ncbi:LysM peptidoglycan-binding domain-containing protein [Amycolatopsis suaedae]|uniref:LysM peptidoglycan-binding domain-containing protein n=1 Tax=Amycolatopsis suaedae TaxID=2510978 RepID=A0A4Q7IZM2_9PSEU|nr:LysM peptidoglycan-binding domain-containing protein [Amycolatopsis suaedae]RZQ59937.1 LysM peptidoglycan-binding domain-containing protein [Amycolatopsis suaedae]
MTVLVRREGTRGVDAYPGLGEDVRRPAHTGYPGHTVVRRRRGEPSRPPTRARVVAGRHGYRPVSCGPREVPRRWPWLIALGLAVGLAVAGLGLLAQALQGPSAGSGEGPVPVQTRVVAVAPGDTLWDLAVRFAPASDPDAVVARIAELNGLASDEPGPLSPGLPLEVPAG